jgi:hypothetical protein
MEWGGRVGMGGGAGVHPWGWGLKSWVAAVVCGRGGGRRLDACGPRVRDGCRGATIAEAAPPAALPKAGGTISSIEFGFRGAAKTRTGRSCGGRTSASSCT